VPGGQFAFDGGQAAGREGRQHLPACGAVGPWQFGLAQLGPVDTSRLPVQFRAAVSRAADRSIAAIRARGNLPASVSVVVPRPQPMSAMTTGAGMAASAAGSAMTSAACRPLTRARCRALVRLASRPAAA
jgi:hypothetical protein